MPTMKNPFRFGAEVIVILQRADIIRSRSNIKTVCGTFFGMAAGSNGCQIWLKGDSIMRVLLTTDIRPLRSFDFLVCSLRAHCVTQKDL